MTLTRRDLLASAALPAFTAAQNSRSASAWYQKMRRCDGRPATHAESPWLYQTCMFSPYFTEQMPAIIREVNSLYDVDGFFTNGWPGTNRPPACSCDACKRLAARGTPAFAEQHIA